jgi:hypothetical protein
MADQVGLDWPGYFRALREDDARALATWLGSQGLRVGEYIEVVDHAYARWPERQPDVFIRLVGRRAASSYAVRKRHFARLVAMLEEAMASGALPGEVAPQELDLPVSIQTERPRVDELLAALDRVTRGCQ